LKRLKLSPHISSVDAGGNGYHLALHTTAFGLIVAVPCMIAHIFLSNITTKIINEIDEYSVKLENLLSARARAGAGR